MKKIGFACKIIPDKQTNLSAKETNNWLQQYNTKDTTVKSLLALPYVQRVDKILHLVENNIDVLKRQFSLLGSWDSELRMMRIGSQILPARTHASIAPLYQEFAVIRAMQGFSEVGEIARKHDIRLSMHPGQFTMLCSNGGDDVINRSLEDLEYHSEVFRLMGYDGSDQRQEINIHGGANRSDFAEEFLRNFRRLARDTRQWLSIENDEFSYCLDDILPLSDSVKICVDINHYWINKGGYLSSSDSRLEQVINSWRGVRPEMHVAYPHEDVLVDHDNTILPDMSLLESSGVKKTKLRAHSEGAWNTAISQYALEFWDRFDLMYEGKSKNLAAKTLWLISKNDK